MRLLFWRHAMKYTPHALFSLRYLILRMRRRTIDHVNEIEKMNRALGDMSALDYAFEQMLNQKGPLTKEKFSSLIYASKPESIRNTEVDFLFDLLDYNDDDIIDKGDFKPNSKFN